jgi:hypothetical protein
MEEKKPRSKALIVAMVVLFPLTLLYFTAVMLNKLHFLEMACVIGIGFFYGLRFGIGELDLAETYYLNIPCWVELIIAKCVIIILGLKIMLTAKERMKLK